MSFSEAPGAGGVYVLGNDLSVTQKMEGVTVSNGMAWSTDHQTFYYIDSPTFEVVSYRYDKRTGNITNKKTAIKFEKKEGSPDGMTIDREGMLWIAHWDGWQVARWNPETGEKLAQIPLPVAKASSCAFGGELFEDLYITSAREGLTKDELERQPLAGSLFVVRHCGYQGMPAFEFRLDSGMFAEC
jgi:sugar lactone lactonase YvrE